MSARKLTSAERQFLATVHEAAFANPFGADRTELDLSIAGLDRETRPDERLAAAISQVSAFLTELDSSAPVRLSQFSGDDQRLVKYAELFSLFHRYVEEFDQLIARQIEVRGGSCPVPFARECLASMRSRGLSEEESLRYFALFYQLRRGYYFIRHSLAGECASMQRLRMVLWNNVFTCDARMYVESLWNRMEDFSTLILGETGSGKGAAAAAIGRSGLIPFDPKQNCFSESFMSSFVELNLSQFPESLIESELFGHRKGAFTGAVEAHPGAFSLCSPHGSIFLDEIGDVSIPVQIKLLRVIQDRTFSAVGSHKDERFHGRVVAATNKPLDALRQEGKFRDDFYYRLCSDVIQVPPLRQRIQENTNELDELLQVVIGRITGEDAGAMLPVVRSTIVESVGLDYAWPGNVRELEQRVRRVLLCGSYTGQRPTSESVLDRLHASLDAGNYDAQTLLSDYCKHLHAVHGTYEAVARITDLDRRTVKKHVQA